MTFPKADKDLLIYLASSTLSEVFSPSLNLSLPAKSTKENLQITFCGNLGNGFEHSLI